MKTKNTVFVVLTMIIVATLAGMLLWDKLPEQMASHWNANDEVDGTMSKSWGVFLMPVVTLGMFGLFMIIPSVDPLKANIEQFRDTFNLFIAFIVAFMLYVHALTLLWSLGYDNFKMSAAMLPFLGLLFIFVGCLMKKAKRNFFIGIRTPWTLSSDTVWDKTHQLGSNLFMLSGALAIAGSFFGGTAAFILVFVPLFATVLATVIYSYVLYRSENF